MEWGIGISTTPVTRISMGHLSIITSSSSFLSPLNHIRVSSLYSLLMVSAGDVSSFLSPLNHIKSFLIVSAGDVSSFLSPLNHIEVSSL
ncbi:hypothetical protein LAZ67_21002629 [Cordylochernes scorpioides]|uniref:Uncharacterized protein n=1 Tax=Cordylochernes scorpioides TaxID=51811 RepID=A0ABY6LMQ8_9ARAC|nr:hypothetical protein LAZ67_21002629 [Cordylochernes scorpioides]